VTELAERRRGHISGAMAPDPWRHPAKLALWVLIGCVVAGTIALALPSFLAVGFTYERNYNEGWNVYNTLRLIRHEVIYDNNLWRVNNYPIGSFLIVAAVNSLVGNLLLAGRIVAAAAFVAIGGLAAMATRGFGGDWIDALFGGALAAGFCYLAAPAWIAVDDPQSLGEAIMLSALVGYLYGPERRLALLRTALLVMLGGFVKHNVVAIPLAITVDIAIRSPHRLLFWLACCAAFGAAFFGLTELVAGGSFVAHLLSPRLFLWQSSAYNFLKLVRLFKFPLLLLIPLWRLTFTRNRLVLGAYGGISLLIAAIFCGFEGTSYNMFQDSAVFLGIAAGVLLHELRPRIAARATVGGWPKAAALAAIPLFLAQPVLAESPQAVAQLFHLPGLLAADRSKASEFAADARYLADRPGPAICESLLMCWQAGKPFILDPFNSRQYILAGRLDQNRLIRRVAAHEYSSIQLREDACLGPNRPDCRLQPQTFKRFTHRFLLAVARYYQIGRRSRDGTFYIPN
jgi:hypothetical protein